jgi:hypothetical protein
VRTVAKSIVPKCDRQAWPKRHPLLDRTNELVEAFRE